MLGRLLVRHEAPAVEERASWSLGQMAGYIKAVAGSSGAVSVDQALTHAATSACIDVLSGSASALPIDVVRYNGNVREPVSPTPTLVAQPSVLVEQDVWLYQLMDSLLTDGNGFGTVTGYGGGNIPRPTGIELLCPAEVRERKVVDGVKQATVSGKVMKVWPYGDLIHVPGKLVRAGSPYADSPLQRASETIGAALAARRFGREFFDSGGHPTTAIYSDDPHLNGEQAEKIKDDFVEASRGRRPVVFGSGLKAEQVSIDPNDSQFIDLMRFAIEEACRFFLVPPSMVFAAMSGQSVTYANVTQADLHYLKHSLDVYLVRIERWLTSLLARPQVVKFNRAALLRADQEARWKVHDLRLRNKSISVDEVRSLEDEQPYGGDFAKPGIPGGPTDPKPSAP